MKKLIKILLLGLSIFIGIVIFNTVRFTSRQVSVTNIETINVDEDAVLQRLSQAIQLPTISYEEKHKFKAQPFIQFHELLEQNYPKIHQVLEREFINSYSVLYKWPGSDPTLKPVLFLSHMDVVPVEPGTEKDWTYPAYSGKVADGFVWGRGALDMKSTLIGIMEAVEMLLKSDFSPRQTIYLAFGHDEEIGGINGAHQIADHLKQNGVQLAYTLDEGMAILGPDLSPTKNISAIIGLAEKGFVTLKITAKAKGGHSSMPPSKSSIGLLSKAITRLENNRMPASIKGPVKLMFNQMGPEMPFVQKVLFANQWVFEGLLVSQLQKISSLNAMLRTTTAPTVISGGVKDNVLPAQAYALVNFRILPGDTIEDVVAHAKAVINEPNVSVEIPEHHASNPSPVSSDKSIGYRLISQSIKGIFGDILIVPGLVLAGTDSKHYSAISDNSYRFHPLIYAPKDTARIHGTNERVAIDNYIKMIQFYNLLIHNISHPGKQ